jgi:hypothetical protein
VRIFLNWYDQQPVPPLSDPLEFIELEFDAVELLFSPLLAPLELELVPGGLAV